MKKREETIVFQVFLCALVIPWLGLFGAANALAQEKNNSIDLPTLCAGDSCEKAVVSIGGETGEERIIYSIIINPKNTEAALMRREVEAFIKNFQAFRDERKTWEIRVKMPRVDPCKGILKEVNSKVFLYLPRYDIYVAEGRRPTTSRKGLPEIKKGDVVLLTCGVPWASAEEVEEARRTLTVTYKERYAVGEIPWKYGGLFQ